MFLFKKDHAIAATSGRDFIEMTDLLQIQCSHLTAIKQEI